MASTAGPLFGNTARASSKNLVEFRAGKMNMKGKLVTPDKRKGSLYVYQSDDSLVHFCWKDRNTGILEDDLIIFPDDTEFKRVNQCTTGRVYILKFKSSSRKYFYWLQEPKTEKDEENCKKVNEFLNNPSAISSQRSGNSTPANDLSNLGESELQNLIQGMSQQELVQLFGGMGGNLGALSQIIGSGSSRGGSSQSSSRPVTATTAATPVTTTTTTTTAAAPSGGNAHIQLTDLQSILSGIPAAQQDKTPVDLSTALTTDALQPLLSNPEFMNRLQEYAPKNDAGETEPLRETVGSPQFQQALSLFSSALESGQLGPLIQQFGLGSEAVTAAENGNMQEFIAALEKGKSKGKEDDENMALD